MTITDVTEPSQTDAITFDVELKHRPEKVWRAITDPVLLNEWLLPVTGFQLAAGTPFTFQTQPHPGWDGRVQCRVVEIELHKKLSYSWVVGDMLNTVVTFTLTKTATGTHLSLVQTGFKPEQKQNFGGARYGWKLMGNKLIDVVAGLD